MNRRSFFGIVGKLCAVGTAVGVAPALLEPIQSVVQKYMPMYYDAAAHKLYVYEIAACVWKGVPILVDEKPKEIG